MPNVETDILVTLRDTDLPQTDVFDAVLPFSTSEVSARAIITERVRAECDRRLPDAMAARLLRLDTLPDEEDADYRTHLRNEDVSTDIQIQRALDSFENNGFLLLIDNRQIEDLDEMVPLRSGCVVTFVQLSPLVGG
ncbi:MAG: hypothetical protein K5905_28240 [Roseibium sp.]|uniref:hypothetical protein n=1 Tax=Roseibium sp. TaxID=1936156 RepID=UPI00260C570F|nr:hypothetical protein [Roseibium sp.]MCV0429356.1 hypothetical protein [Roseibium sp.]